MKNDYTYICEECRSSSVSFDERLGELVCNECGLVIVREMFEETVLPLDKSGNTIHSPDKGRLGSIIKGKVGKIPSHRLNSGHSTHLNKGLAFCKMLLANFTASKSIRDRCEEVYLELYRKNVINKASYEDRACAIVYFCLLENNTPVKYADVCSIEFQSNKSRVIKLVKKIKKNFRRVTKPIDYRYEIERVANKVLNDVGYVNQCLDTHNYFQPIIAESEYNIPITYPMAICWIASNVNCRSDITATLIHKKCNISRWAIRNTTNKLLKLIGKKEINEIKGKKLM